jgi:non-specific serine/threonine protein kinase
MDSGEEKVVESLLQEFINFTVPEYIVEGAHAILAAGGVQKL